MFNERKPGVFFDKDGVLEIPEYRDGRDWAIKDPDRMTLYHDVETVNEIKKRGYLVFVITNQPDIALGKIAEATKEELKHKFKSLLIEKSIFFDEVMYCHHHPDSINPNYSKECECRKPKPGMILALAQKWHVDLSLSFVIGDTWKDIEAGKSASCTTILIDRPWTHKDKCAPDYIVNSLGQTLDIIKSQ